MSDAKWAGTLAIGMGWSVYRGPVGSAHLHRHLALQLTLPIDSLLQVQIGTSKPETVASCLIGSRVPHVLIGDNTEIISLYADPLTDLGQSLKSALLNGRVQVWEIAPFEKRCLEAILNQQVGSQMAVEFRALIADWLGAKGSVTNTIDPRLLAATQIINTKLAERHRLSDIAAAVGLSPGRLSVLFRRDLGVAFRAYVQWARIVAAAGAFAHGANGTEAAYQAGFADQAHFTRTFQRLFGTSPTSGLSASTLCVISDVDARGN